MASLFSTPEQIQQEAMQEMRQRQLAGLQAATQQVAGAPDLAGRLAGLGSSIGQGVTGLFAKPRVDKAEMELATKRQKLMQTADLKTAEGMMKFGTELAQAGDMQGAASIIGMAAKMPQAKEKEQWETFTDSAYPNVLFRRNSAGKVETILKPPAPGTTVNVGAKKGAEVAASEFQNAIKSANYADKTKASIGFVRRAMEGIDTGSLTDVRLALGEFASSLSIKMPEIENLRSANTAMGQMVMAGLDAFPGQISNQERQFVEGIMPKLTQTPEGREAIMEFLDRLSNRSIDYRKLMTQHIKENGYELVPEGGVSFYEKWDKFQVDNPLLEGFKALGFDDTAPAQEPTQKSDSIRNKWETL